MIDNNSYVGYRRGAIEAMLIHFGFVHKNEGSDGKHRVFDHVDYPDLRVNLKESAAAVPWPTAEHAVKLCMEVKRRNALLNVPVFSAIPEWVFQALPAGTRIVSEDNRVAFESGAVLDLDAAEMPPVRHYMLEMRGKTIRIRSMDYPLEEYSLSFNVKDGSANIGGLKVMFDRLDAQVLAHCDAVATRFNDDLKRLIDNHGFEIHEEQPDYARPVWVMTHPVYDTQVRLPAPRKGEAIADETLEKLDALLEESQNAVLKQIELTDQLEEQGWAVTKHGANGSAPHMTFTHPSGKSFSVPAYGEHAVFDERLVKANINIIENALADDSITVVPSAISTNEVDSPVVSGPVVKVGRVSHKPIIGLDSRSGND